MWFFLYEETSTVFYKFCIQNLQTCVCVYFRFDMLGHLKQIFLVGGKNSSGARFAQLFRPSRFMSIKVRRFFGMPRILWGTQEIYRLVRLLLSTYIELYWVQYHRFFFHDLSISVSKVGIFKRKKKNLKICSFLGR